MRSAAVVGIYQRIQRTVDVSRERKLQGMKGKYSTLVRLRLRRYLAVKTCNWWKESYQHIERTRDTSLIQLEPLNACNSRRLPRSTNSVQVI